MNEQRDLTADPAAAVRAGDISAMGLVDEILHYVIELYQRDRNPDATAVGARGADGQRPCRQAARTDAAASSPSTSRRSRRTAAKRRRRDYLGGRDGRHAEPRDRPGGDAPALAGQPERGVRAADELFDDAPLETRTAYDEGHRRPRRLVQDQPGFGPEDEDLVTLLRQAGAEGGATRRRAAALDRRQLGLRRGAVRRSAGHQPRRPERGGARAVDALQRDTGRWRRHASPRRRGHGRRRAPRVRLRWRRARSRVRALQPRPRLDAAGHPAGEVDLCLAGPAVARLQSADLASRPDSRRGAGHHRQPWLHRPVADRAVGAKSGVQGNQADARQPGGRRIGLLADGLPHRGRPGRGRGLRQPSRSGLVARHSPGERHGAQPHGHRLALGGRASRLVHAAR